MEEKTKKKIELNEEQGENMKKFLIEQKGWKPLSFVVPELPWMKKDDKDEEKK